MNEKKILFTVFTPTYNRGKLLRNVYNSLCHQTIKAFEWIIVDDGSTDNTFEVIEKLKKESKFPIKYVYKNNGGKHTAINEGLKYAKGDFFLIFDSDDNCVPNALEVFKKHWDSIPNKEKKIFSSISALVKNKKQQIIGTKFPSDIYDSNFIDIDFIDKIKGDKWVIHRTNILKKFPFKEFNSEKYIAESSVYHLMGKTYKTRFINEALLIAEYQPDGLSSRSYEYRKNSPYSTIYTYSNKMFLNIPIKYKIKYFLNCIRFAIVSNNLIYCIKTILKKLKEKNEEN